MKTAERLPVACLAPPLTDDALTRYAQLIESVGDDRAELRDALRTLFECVSLWWDLPESDAKGQQWELTTADGVKRRAEVKPLTDDLKGQLYDATPWMRELQAMEPLLESLPTGRANADGSGAIVEPEAAELRNLAFHLLWHAKEITCDREPLTQDKLQ